jgi:hypothetical protein
MDRHAEPPPELGLRVVNMEADGGCERACRQADRVMLIDAVSNRLGLRCRTEQHQPSQIRNDLPDVGVGQLAHFINKRDDPFGLDWRERLEFSSDRFKYDAVDVDTLRSGGGFSQSSGGCDDAINLDQPVGCTDEKRLTVFRRQAS